MVWHGRFDGLLDGFEGGRGIGTAREDANGPFTHDRGRISLVLDSTDQILCIAPHLEYAKLQLHLIIFERSDKRGKVSLGQRRGKVLRIISRNRC